jgi:broad specificity phosphatase PhoE
LTQASTGAVFTVGTILLVRHGQASFGANDYDVLSPLGRHQAAQLGRALARQGTQPTALASGALRRQRTSAEVLASEAGWALDASVDPGWDEFDQNRLAVGAASGGQAAPAREEFQAALETGMRAWAGAGDAPGASESFSAFTTRTEAALRSIATGQPPGTTAVIVTSGGVISWLTTALLSGGVEQWIRLNRVCVNTGVTKLVNGRRGISLVSFNDHSHLAGPELTYR